MKKITVNKIKCLICNDVIESKHIHEYKRCKCSAVGVDGGLEYCKRIGDPLHYVEMSETVDSDALDEL